MIGIGTDIVQIERVEVRRHLATTTPRVTRAAHLLAHVVEMKIIVALETRPRGEQARRAVVAAHAKGLGVDHIPKS